MVANYFAIGQRTYLKRICSARCRNWEAFTKVKLAVSSIIAAT